MLASSSTSQCLAVPGGLGTFNCTFILVDTEGCQYGTTLAVTIIDVPFAVDAGPDVSLCDGPGMLNGAVIMDDSECVHGLVHRESFGDGWNGGAHLAVNSADSTTLCALLSGAQVDTTPLPMSHGQQITLWTRQARLGTVRTVSGSWDAYMGVLKPPVRFFCTYEPTEPMSDATVKMSMATGTAGSWIAGN